MNDIISLYDVFILDQWGVMHDGYKGYDHAINSVEKLIKSFNRIPDDNPVIIDMKEVPNVDLSGIFGLEDLIKLSQSQNRNVAITNANEEIRNNFIALKFIENIGSENIGKTPVEFFQKMNNDPRA